jgi:hypothetical protein
MNDSFSAGHTAVLVVSLLLAFTLSPAVVDAASRMFTIKDADSRSKAQVDKGRLRIGDGQGPITVDLHPSSRTVAVSSSESNPLVVRDASAPAETVVAFETPPEGVAPPVGNDVVLGTADVSAFSQIRFAAATRCGSTNAAEFRLRLVQGERDVANLDAATIVQPCNKFTEIYEMPGRTVKVLAQTHYSASAPVMVDAVIYGRP